MKDHRFLKKIILLLAFILIVSQVNNLIYQTFTESPEVSYLFMTDYQSLNTASVNINITFYNSNVADILRMIIEEDQTSFEDSLKRSVKTPEEGVISDFKISYFGLESDGSPLTILITFREEGTLFKKTDEGVYYKNGQLMNSKEGISVTYDIALPEGYTAKNVAPEAKIMFEEEKMHLVWERETTEAETYYFELTRIQVQDLKLYRTTQDAAINFEETTTFNTNDEYVAASVKVINGSKTDELKWLFIGPNDIRYEDSYKLGKDGNDFYGYTLPLNFYDPEKIVGSWTVTLYVNGLKTLEAYFTVEKAPERGLITIVDHALCKNVEDGEPVDITSTFTNDEVVYCWLKIQNGTLGDQMGRSWPTPLTFLSGGVTAYATPR